MRLRQQTQIVHRFIFLRTQIVQLKIASCIPGRNWHPAFSIRSIRFLGCILLENRISLKPEWVKTVTQSDRPSNKTELQSFLEMVIYPNAPPSPHYFTHCFAMILSYESIKNVSATVPSLAIFDLSHSTKIFSDSCAIFHEQGFNTFQPVAFASRTFSATGEEYASIQKKSMA